MPSHISRCYLNNAFENTEYDLRNMSDCDVNDSIFLSEIKDITAQYNLGAYIVIDILDCVHG